MKRLSSFSAKTNLEKSLLTSIASQLVSKDEEKEYANIFLYLDTNRDGKLSKEELVAGFDLLGLNEDKDIDEIMKIVDTNGNGFIEFSEFLTAALD